MRGDAERSATRRRVELPHQPPETARRSLMREVSSERDAASAGGDRAERREAVLHALAMSRRRRRAGHRL